MGKSIVAQNVDGQSLHVEYDHNPDWCPICHVTISPNSLTAIYSGSPLAGRLQIAFRCPNRDCDQVFVGSYERGGPGRGYSTTFLFKDIAPVTPRKMLFSDEIKETSPSFVEIFNQAIAAESQQLDQLAGMGLRKALEFLIKDYLINQRPADAENIRKVQLSPCINNYVDDPRLKQCAERATWLGNDETHYERKWTDQNIEDLKLLIKLSLNWVESALLTNKYAQRMIK